MSIMTTLNFKKFTQSLFGISSDIKEYYLNIDQYPVVKVSTSRSFNSICVDVPEMLWKERSLNGVTFTASVPEYIQPHAIAYEDVMGGFYEPFDGFSLTYNFPFAEHACSFSPSFTESLTKVVQDMPRCETIDEYLMVNAIMLFHIQKVHKFMKDKKIAQEGNTIIITENNERKK